MAKKIAAAGGTIRVRATAVGFYDDIRRRVGDVFTLHPRTGTFTELELDANKQPVIDDGGLLKTRVTKEVEKTLTAEEQFNTKWMERVSANTPEVASSANERIRNEHDAILAARMSGATPPADNPPSGDEDVI